MKIWGDISRISGVYNRQKDVKRAQKAEKSETKKDAVSISGTAKDLQTIQKALNQVPDIRHEKVENLEKKYNTGSYNPEGRDIAQKIIESVFDRKA